MRCVDENIQIPEQNIGLLGSNRIDHQCFAGKCISFPENLSGTDVAQNAFAAPQVEIFNINASGQHQPDLVRGASGRQNHFIFFKMFLAHTAQREHFFIF